MTAAALSYELACHMLYGLDISYEEVVATHLRRMEEQIGPLEAIEVWEAEVETNFGIAIALRGHTPLDVATAVAGKIVELVATKRARGWN